MVAPHSRHIHQNAGGSKLISLYSSIIPLRCCFAQRGHGIPVSDLILCKVGPVFSSFESATFTLSSSLIRLLSRPWVQRLPRGGVSVLSESGKTPESRLPCARMPDRPLATGLFPCLLRNDPSGERSNFFSSGSRPKAAPHRCGRFDSPCFAEFPQRLRVLPVEPDCYPVNLCVLVFGSHYVPISRRGNV